MAQRIIRVKAHSPAARHGILDGETLVSIDRTPVLDQVDYQFLSVRRAPVLRIRAQEVVPIQMDDYVRKMYPKAYALAEKLSVSLSRKLRLPVAAAETTLLAIHIQRVL